MMSFQLPNRFVVRQTLKRLQNHHRRDHIRRHRRAATTVHEQVLEHLIREQPQPVLRQERVHRALRDQMGAQRRRVEELTISPR
jgi:hypothetical protein